MSRATSPASLFRRLIRRVGFDVVRVGGAQSTLPADFDGASSATIRAVAPYTMTSPERLFALCEAVRYVVRAGIEGAVVECGVWRGGSMMAAARTLTECGVADRDLYLFDTFEGMPEPGDRDVSIAGEHASALAAQGQRSEDDLFWCYAPLERVRSALAATGYPSSKVHFVPGRVEDTIPAAAPERIALLRLDTDWYDSTRHELECLYPRLMRGGVLILDDYGHWQGARQAADEYLARHGGKLLLNRIDYTGRVAVKVFE
ncbi:MAG TPA: TylF/MycF/NovP-related O-methyltransferase [Steroidobacteraceae bacterium]|nr:TylF/MycF/NovP-related O-methyltransferase [Steroidobacteraceae bacterium]